MKNFEILDMVYAIGTLTQEDATFPAKVNYALCINETKLQPYAKAIDATRNNLVKKYGYEDQNGSVSVSEDKKNEFLKEYTEFLNEESDFDTEELRNFDAELLDKIDISPKKFKLLFKFAK